MYLAAPAATAPAGAGAYSPLISMLFILVIFWVLVIRPQQQKDKAHKEMLSKLKKGDKVIMMSGIHGEIVDIKDDTLTIKIAERVDVRATRGSISQVKS